jgi:RNA polymerase sigma factor (sigma-70 family)
VVTIVMSPSDLELLDRWVTGAASAGEDLVRRHYASIARFFFNKVSQDPDELVQRTFLRCIEQRASYRKESPFRGYLFGIARNVLYEHLREKQRSHAFDSGVSSVHALDPSPSQVLAQRRDVTLLFESLRRVPIDHQMLLELFYWEGLSTNEVAGVLGIPQGTVKGRLSRARRILAAEYERLAREQGIVVEPIDRTLEELGSLDA